MPPITGLAIPVHRAPRPPERPAPSSSQVSVKSRNQPRVYPDGPLPIRLSDDAPRQAKITGRVATPDKVAYTIEVGGVNMDDVGIDEILEYVSPYELERFETQQFEEEIEIDRIAQEAADAEDERKRERQKIRAQRKGIVLFQDPDDDSMERNEEAADGGKYGRARPTYKHLFKKMKVRRRRKRDPLTNKLLPLSDDENKGAAELESSSDGEQAVRPPSMTPQTGLPEPAKRRRREKDPRTGELLPLEAERQSSTSRSRNQPAHELALGVPYKRRRRKRHPITREMMPLGWRYEPEAEGDKRGSASGNASVESTRRLSIVREPEAKRPRLASVSASSSDPRAQSIDPLRSFLTTGGQQSPGLPKLSNIVVELNSSESEESEDELQRLSPPKPTPRGKTSMMQPNHKSAISSAAVSSRAESSSEPITLASFLKSSKTAGGRDASSDDGSSSSSEVKPNKTPTNGKTSIINPTGSQTAKPVGNGKDEDDTDEDDLGEDEYIVESILGHHLSDPRSHPGKPSTMLYKTKWEGFSDPTWEPAESFDSSIIESYRKHVGLDRSEQTQLTDRRKTEKPSKGQGAIRPTSQTVNATRQVGTESREKEEDNDEEDEADEEGVYEVESILAHHKSDPRTHPGKPIVMLYQTKWKGYSKTTWEPASSFTDRQLLHNYQRRAGLRS